MRQGRSCTRQRLSAACVAAPEARKLLQGREKITDSGRFIWDDDLIANRPARATADMPNASLIVGDWSQCVVGTFGAGICIDVNPNQNFHTGVEPRASCSSATSR